MWRFGLAGLKKASRLSVIEWSFLARAVLELSLARMRHAMTPASKIVADLRRRPEEHNHPSLTDLEIHRLSWAIRAAAARMPWRADCLLQAMAADRWLRCRGHSPEFFLGVAKHETGRFEAHAWLQCQGIPVTGGTASRDFEKLLIPAEPELRLSL